MVYYDKRKEDYPPGLLEEERFFRCCEEEDGKLDWFFHPDYCKLAGLEDYQRLVPRNYVRMFFFWGQDVHIYYLYSIVLVRQTGVTLSHYSLKQYTFGKPKTS